MKDASGNRLQVNLKAHDAPSPVASPAIIEKYEEKSAGSNKMLLYIALFIGLAVAIASGYMLLKESEPAAKSPQTAARKNFGYKL